MSDDAQPAPLANHSIRDLAEVMSVPELADLTGTTVLGVTPEGSDIRKERIARFPIRADEPWRTELADQRERFERYRVSRIHLMSIPECTIAGPHLIALTAGGFVRETVRGGASYNDPAIFGRGDDGAIHLQPGTRRTSIDGTSLVIGAKAMRGYYHWMTEVVPRLVLARRHPELRELPVLMRPTRQPHELETLRMLDVEPTTVKAPTIRVERAVIPTYPIHPRRGGRYSHELAELLREFATTYVSRQSGPSPSRIYLSRRDAGKRHIANEKDVEALLEQLGFTCMTLTGRPVAEQVQLFANAEIVVAQHGAGLTNILFSRPGTRIIELYPRGFVNPSPFWTFSSLAGLNYEMLVCNVKAASVPESGDVKDSDLIVDLPALEAMLNRSTGRSWRRLWFRAP